MSQIICIIGNKGGTGRRPLSHMLCQGFGLLGQRSACVLTDTSASRSRPTDAVTSPPTPARRKPCTRSPASCAACGAGSA